MVIWAEIAHLLGALMPVTLLAHWWGPLLGNGAFGAVDWAWEQMHAPQPMPSTPFLPKENSSPHFNVSLDPCQCTGTLSFTSSSICPPPSWLQKAKLSFIKTYIFYKPVSSSYLAYNFIWPISAWPSSPQPAYESVSALLVSILYSLGNVEISK